MIATRKSCINIGSTNEHYQTGEVTLTFLALMVEYLVAMS